MTDERFSRGASFTQRRYVLTVGCFDCFHHGHEILLEHMLSEGDYLLVGVHDDESIFINKKIRVAQRYEDRVKLVRSFAPQAIEVFEVSEADPTAALQHVYEEHETACRRQGIRTQWAYMRGKDMTHFPGRHFIESVMPIIWHDYTAAVSSTMIRKEVLPLARALVNFAHERVVSDQLLRLLERSALLDPKLVIRYLLETVDAEGSSPSSPPKLVTDAADRDRGESLPALSSLDSHDPSIRSTPQSSSRPASARIPKEPSAGDLNVPAERQSSRSALPSVAGAPRTQREQVLAQIITALFTLFQSRKNDFDAATCPGALTPAAATRTVQPRDAQGEETRLPGLVQRKQGDAQVPN